MTTSNPENDRSQRKAALSAARKKLALRKKQREELRAQRAARLNGKIEASSFSSTVSASPLMNKKSASSAPKKSAFDFMDDSKDDFSSNNKVDTTSLYRDPWKLY